MLQRFPNEPRMREIMLCMSVVCLLYVCLLWSVLTHASEAQNTEPAWANPTEQSIKKIGDVSSAQNQPNYTDNLDCTLLSYRLTNTNDMGSGCFIETAFGLMDPDSNLVIFNGTDEALPITSYAPNQVFLPWPRAGGLISISPTNTGGSYISLYKNPLPLLEDQRNYLFQLKSKKIIGPPDLQLVDKLGQRLVINTQTIAFSDGGSWLVAETRKGSFVRINLASLDVKPFAPSYVSSGGPTSTKSKVSISPSGRYVAIFNFSAQVFKVVDLGACSNTSTNLEPENCPFHDFLPFAKSQINELEKLNHVRFINDSLITFEAIANETANNGIYLISPTEKITSLIDYLGTGDSYASGEGAFNYISGTDDSNNMCHLSSKSYPLLLRNDLFNLNSGHSVACSGAALKDVASDSDTYKGQVNGVLDFKNLKLQNPELLNSVLTNFAPGYIAQQRFATKYQPSVITVNIGGNDIGFGNILEQCVMPKISRHISDSTCFGTYEERQELLDQIDRTKAKWTATFKSLSSKSPQSQIYVIGYPKVASDEGKCALNVHLGKFEIAFSLELIDHINASIQESASLANVNYIDISEALVGHRLCEANSQLIAVNGLTAGKDAGIFGINVLAKESYHPNALGHELIKQEILNKSNRFRLKIPATGQVADKAKFLSQPSSGQQITTRISSEFTSKIGKINSSINVRISGESSGIKPNSNYSIKMDGINGPAVYTSSSNSYGDINTEIVVPADTTSGAHTISIIGEGHSSNIINVSQPILITSNIYDIDDDGITNDRDSCPTVINSDSDVDNDNIDDSCDGFIGNPHTSTPEQSISVASSINANKIRTNTGSGSLLGNSTVNPNSTKLRSKSVNSKSNSLLEPISSYKKAKLTNYRYENLSINWWLLLLFAFIMWILLFILSIFWEKRFKNNTQYA